MQSRDPRRDRVKRSWISGCLRELVTGVSRRSTLFDSFRWKRPSLITSDHIDARRARF
jgi:hypothetical protein